MSNRNQLVDAILELADTRVRHDRAESAAQAKVLARRVVRQQRRIRMLATMIGVVSALTGGASAAKDAAAEMQILDGSHHEQL